MKADYIIRAGETLTLYLLAVEGDIDDVAEISAKLKPAGPKGSVPSVSTAAVATFTVTDAEMPDLGWVLSLSDEQTMPLKPGLYITNARLDMVDGSVQKTEPVTIEIRGSVS